MKDRLEVQLRRHSIVTQFTPHRDGPRYRIVNQLLLEQCTVVINVNAIETDLQPPGNGLPSIDPMIWNEHRPVFLISTFSSGAL